MIDLSQNAGDHVLDQFTEIQCPYCAEVMVIRVDLSAGAQSYVEDCQVCCQAMQIGVDVADAIIALVNAEAGCSATATFDHRAQRLAGMTPVADQL